MQNTGSEEKPKRRQSIEIRYEPHNYHNGTNPLQKSGNTHKDESSKT